MQMQPLFSLHIRQYEASRLVFTVGWREVQDAAKSEVYDGSTEDMGREPQEKHCNRKCNCCGWIEISFTGW